MILYEKCIELYKIVAIEIRALIVTNMEALMPYCETFLDFFAYLGTYLLVLVEPTPEVACAHARAFHVPALLCHGAIRDTAREGQEVGT